MLDKNLFLHDLAIVAILKNEGAYLKEWLDYHLAAGVEHFYLYDNDSTDNQAEVAKPYVEAGLVDYILFHGKAMQYVAYNDAVKNFKFLNRYMAFIDLDEFIFPKNTTGTISEVVDKILSDNPKAAGLGINWQIFGSNGQDKADYSRGVLERFIRRAPSDWFMGSATNVKGGNVLTKSVVNPRHIYYMWGPHEVLCLEGFMTLNEKGEKVSRGLIYPVCTEKIVVNHYYTKSFEEFMEKKTPRGWPCPGKIPYSHEQFIANDRNEVFDDDILKYRTIRTKNFFLESADEKFSRVTEILVETLSRTEISLETALTCRALSTYLREHFPNEADYWKICEVASFGAILKSLNGINIADAQLFIRELPNLLRLPYPVVEELRRACLQIIQQTMEYLRLHDKWKKFFEMDYIQDLLRLTIKSQAKSKKDSPVL